MTQAASELQGLPCLLLGLQPPWQHRHLLRLPCARACSSVHPPQPWILAYARGEWRDDRRLLWRSALSLSLSLSLPSAGLHEYLLSLSLCPLRLVYGTGLVRVVDAVPDQPEACTVYNVSVMPACHEAQKRIMVW